MPVLSKPGSKSPIEIPRNRDKRGLRPNFHDALMTSIGPWLGLFWFKCTV